MVQLFLFEIQEICFAEVVNGIWVGIQREILKFWRKVSDGKDIGSEFWVGRLNRVPATYSRGS